MKISEIEKVLEKIKKDNGNIDYDMKMNFTVDLHNGDAVSFRLDLFKHFEIVPNGITKGEAEVYWDKEITDSLDEKIEEAIESLKIK